METIKTFALPHELKELEKEKVHVQPDTDVPAKKEGPKMVVNLREPRITREQTHSPLDLLENFTGGLENCYLSFEVHTQLDSKEVIVRRTADDFYELRHLLLRNRPHVLIPLHPRKEFDAVTDVVEVGYPPDVGTPVVVETTRRKLERFLQQCCDHPELSESMELHDFVFHENRSPKAEYEATKEEPGVVEKAQYAMEKALGLPVATTGGQLEEAAWAATAKYLGGLDNHLRKVIDPARNIAALHFQLEEEMKRLSAGLHGLAEYEDELTTPRDEITALRHAAAAVGSAALVTRHQAEDVEPKFADALEDLTFLKNAFAVADEERRRLWIKVMKLDIPRHAAQERLHDLEATGAATAIEGLSDRVAALFLHERAVKQRHKEREREAEFALRKIESAEEEAMKEYESYCERLRRELQYVHDAKADALRSAAQSYISNQTSVHGCAKASWESPTGFRPEATAQAAKQSASSSKPGHED